jgi:hypothetical protein
MDMGTEVSGETTVAMTGPCSDVMRRDTPRGCRLSLVGGEVFWLPIFFIFCGVLFFIYVKNFRSGLLFPVSQNRSCHGEFWEISGTSSKFSEVHNPLLFQIFADFSLDFGEFLLHLG